MNKKNYELSNPQKNIWTMEQFYRGTNINNICGTLTIKQDVDVEKLNDAVNIFVQNNKSFGLNFVEEDGKLKQYFTNIDYEVYDKVELKDYSEVQKLASEVNEKIFSITDKKLYKFILFKLENGHGGFIIKTHHIISDAATFAMIGTEIVEIYDKILKSEEIAKKEYSYEEYIEDEKEYIKSEKFLKDKEYWNNLYDTVPEVASIPTLKKEVISSSGKAKRKEFMIDIEILKKISDFCKENRISNFNFFMAIYAIYIGRVSSLNDFVIGTPILNRTNFKEKHTTGMFINTAPLRVKIEEKISFIDFVKQIAQSSISMLRFQKYPYEMLLEDLRNKQSNLPALFDIMLSYQITKANDRNIEIPYEVEWLPTTTISNGMYIHFHDNNDEGLNIAYDYKIEKYDENDIDNMHNRILHIIEQVVENGNCLEQDIEIVTKEEKNKILNEFNNTFVDYPKDKTIVDLFEEQVEKTPNNIAVVFENKKLTYNELNIKANQLANYLIEQKVEKGDIVGILLNKSLEVIVSMFAILKAGATFLPIDIDYPKERLEYILNNSKPKLILSSKEINLSTGVKQILVDLSNDTIYCQKNEGNLKKNITTEDVMYVMYTSGSTGNPKGVMVKHKNIIRLAMYPNFIKFKEHEVMVQTGTIVFDACIFEIFGSLLHGFQLYIIEKENLLDLEFLYKFLIDKNVTILFLTTGLFNQIGLQKPEIFKNLRYLLTGGDVISTRSVENIKKTCPNINIINCYGPTENGSYSTCYQIKGNEENIPIGKPITNSTAYVVSKTGSLCPIGVPGELWVGGEGVAKGYLKNEELTSEKFINSAFGKDIMYKTGDLVKWLPDGNIEFIGRIDNQVKIRGFRVELSEIDQKIILQNNNIKNSITILQNINNNKIICSYIISDSKINTKQLIKELGEHLPNYMIPKFIIQLEKFPLNINGKIDRKMLPTPNGVKIDREIVKIRNNVDKFLVDTLEKLLNLKDISIDDSFFELGGDSLLAITFVTIINEKIKTQISVKDIFKVPVIKDLSDLILNIKVKNNEEKINKAEKREYYPVSSAQKRMYYSSLIDGKDSVLYNISGGLILDKVPDIEKLNTSFKKIIENNEVFRTYFDIENNQVVQKILEKVEFNIKMEKSKSSNVDEIITQFIKPFNLSIAPLLRVNLIELANSQALLLIDMHHIIGDGKTLEILIKQLSDLYNGNKIKNRNLDYKDFSIWENDNINSNKYKNDEKYWLEQFQDEIPVLELPTSYMRTSMQSFEGNEKSVLLDEEDITKINSICKENNVTPFMLLLSVYYILLSVYSRTEDIVVGTPISGRYNEQTLDMMGMFVNTLAIRSNVDSKLTFKEFLNKVKEQLLNAYEHQNYPSDELIKKLGIQRDTSRNPLFDVIFIYQNLGYPKINLEGIEARYYVPKSKISKFDLSLEAIPEENQLKLRFEYCTKLFTKEFINNFAKHYINVLRKILRNIEIKIPDIDIITEKEKKQIIYDFNNNTTDYPKDKTVIELFEEQVEKTPNKVAVVFQNQELTYRELNEKANNLAMYLLNKYKICKQEPIPILMNKCIENIVSILAIIKLGAVYVPIDIEYPKDRISYILEDINARIVLTRNEYNETLPESISQIYVDINEEECQNNVNILNEINSENLIYIMYTSGSTGKPKGVKIKNKNVVRLVKNTNYIDFSKCKRILQTGSIVFDASTFEIWGALLNGLSLYLIEKNDLLTPKILEEYLIKNEIDALWLTSPLFNQLSEENPKMFSKVKYLLTGGDVLSPKHINKVKKENEKLTIINGYGPTENTTFSCCFKIEDFYNESIPIGKAIANSSVYVVSKNGKILPIGVPGELWVGGDGVGEGYLNREELTKEKFIDNPFGKGKIYKTGDLVKLLPDGNIDFIGRIDNQVKIRGFRIELNEIDNVIKEYPYINKTFTTIKTIENKKCISTYFTADKKTNTKDINLYLQEKLPFYMVPQFWVQLDEFPLTINGKVDKSKLPNPELLEINEYVLPENEVQEKLCDIWKKLFKVKKVSILDNFFELGGDSLTAIKFQTEALKLDININYSDIFESPTIKGLSEKKQKEQLYQMDKKYDYSKINKMLEANTIENINEKTNKRTYDNLLLCGATGYLGAHILDAYLSSNKNGNIYCLVRKKGNIDEITRLKNILNFYFDDKYDSYFESKIKVVYGDITCDNLGLNEKEYKKLGKTIDVVINSAALVKHFGDFKMFESINVIGTRNIVKFCMDFNKKLYHISTMSVSGIHTPEEIINNDQERIVFGENSFYVGQNLNNAYVYTKFEAEKEIFERIGDGLQACVLRMGNISSRISDGKFQMNVSENAFINRIKSILNIKAIQSRFLNHAIEFTPVDASAKAIISIINNNPEFTVFHVFNTKVITIPDVIAILKSLGYTINTVDDRQFAQIINEFLKKDELKGKISGLIPDLNKNKTLSLLSKTIPNGYFTTMYLKQIGYEWPEIDKEYILKYIEYFKKIGYIE